MRDRRRGMAWHKLSYNKKDRDRECSGVFSYFPVTSTGNSTNVKINNYILHVCRKICASGHNLRKFVSYPYLVILTCAGRIPRSRQESIKTPLCTLLLRIKRIRGSARCLSIIYTHDVSRRTQIPKNKTTYMWKSGMDDVHAGWIRAQNDECFEIGDERFYLRG